MCINTILIESWSCGDGPVILYIWLVQIDEKDNIVNPFPNGAALNNALCKLRVVMRSRKLPFLCREPSRLSNGWIRLVCVVSLRPCESLDTARPNVIKRLSFLKQRERRLMPKLVLTGAFMLWSQRLKSIVAAVQYSIEALSMACVTTANGNISSQCSPLNPFGWSPRPAAELHVSRTYDGEDNMWIFKYVRHIMRSSKIFPSLYFKPWRTSSRC